MARLPQERADRRPQGARAEDEKLHAASILSRVY
jgi:hypothetical protein